MSDGRIVVPAVGGDATGAEWARRWLEATNGERAKAGLPAYRAHPALEEVARWRCDYLVATHTFTHDDPLVSGETYWERLLALGARTWHLAGENLAMNKHARDPLGLALSGLLASPTHRANILAAEFDAMGSWAGIRDDGWTVFAFVFAGGLA